MICANSSLLTSPAIFWSALSMQKLCKSIASRIVRTFWDKIKWSRRQSIPTRPWEWRTTVLCELYGWTKTIWKHQRPFQAVTLLMIRVWLLFYHTHLLHQRQSKNLLAVYNFPIWSKKDDSENATVSWVGPAHFAKRTKTDTGSRISPIPGWSYNLSDGSTLTCWVLHSFCSGVLIRIATPSGAPTHPYKGLAVCR